MDINNGSYASKYIYQNSNIKGIKEVFASFATDVRDLDDNPNNGFYGLTKKANAVFQKVNSVEEANKLTTETYLKSGPGIIYYDALTSRENSFIQFNLNASNDLFPTLMATPAFMPLSQS